MAETYTVTKASGATQTREFGSNKVVSETTAPDPETGEVKSVVRILIEPTESGKGIRRSKPVETAEEFKISTQAEKAQEDINVQLEGTGQEARAFVDLREETISATSSPITTSQRLVEERTRTSPINTRLGAISESISKPTTTSREVVNVAPYSIPLKIAKDLGEKLLSPFPKTKEKIIGDISVFESKTQVSPKTAKTIGAVGLTGLALLSPVPGDELAALKLTSQVFKTGIKAGAVGFGTVAGAKEVSERTVTKDFSALPKELQEEVFTRSFEESAKVQSTPFNLLRGVSSELSTREEKQEFVNVAYDVLVEKGFDPKEANILATQAGLKRRVVGTAELAGQLFIGAGAEKIGRTLVKSAVAKRGVSSGFTNFLGTTFNPISKAGIFEGGAGFALSKFAEDKEIKPIEVASAGALGAASAGIISGGIRLASGAGKVGSVASERVADILDPLEAPSDVVADIVEGVGKIGKRSRVISVVPMTSFSEGPSVSSNIDLPEGTKVFQGVTLPSISETSSFNEGPSVRVATLAPSENVGFVGVSPKPEVPLPVPIETKPEVPVPIETKPFVSPKSEIPVPVQPNPFVSPKTEINPFVSIRPSVPVVVATGDLPGFFLPPKGGFGLGGLPGKKVKRDKEYVASFVAVATGFTGKRSKGAELTGFGIRPIEVPKIKKKKKNKRKSVKRKK